MIAIDTRGHGRLVIGTYPLRYRQLQEDVTAVFTTLGPQNFGIIGHSDGGVVALRLMLSNRSSLL
nr:alpha/beta hydrolase [Acetobacter cibinongensis]